MIIYKNTKINDLRTPIEKADLNARWKEIGYDAEPEYIEEGIAYAKEIKDTWDASQTNLSNKFYNDKKLVYMPAVDTSNATDMSNMFSYCKSLTTIPELDTQNATDMCYMYYYCGNLNSELVIDAPICKNMCSIFYFCSNLNKVAITAPLNENFEDGLRECKNLITISELNMPKCTNFHCSFYNDENLENVPPINLDGVTDVEHLFYSCQKLTRIVLLGDPTSISNMYNMFLYIGQSGTLIYDHNFDYSKVIKQLKKDAPTWVAKPDYEPQECLSLVITADDVIGNATTTTVHYVAMTNGVNSITGERLENVEVKGDAKSEPFEMNPSYDASRQVTVSFTYLGCSATTTITQGPKQHPTASVDLMSNWELAPAETIPNPDSQIYEGVYQSVHKGQYDVKDKMTITFKGMSNFELYIRSYAESTYDYVFAGRLDQLEPTYNDNQASTSGNQQSGTDIGSYTKVEYPNDGGQHTITVIYRKDSSGESGDDRGYVFFKKPVE